MTRGEKSTSPSPVGYIEDAYEFLGWADQHLTDLEALLTDHRFLLDTPESRILFTVDFYDVLKLAFPFVDVKDKRATLDDEAQNDMLRGQIARSCFLFNMPRRKSSSYYPILLPAPYVREFFSHFSSSRIIDPKAEPFHARFRELQKRVIDKIGKNTIEVLEEKEQGKLLELLTDVCPELLFALSGHYNRGLEVVRRLFQDNYVTMEFEQWGLPEHLRQEVFDGEKFRDFEFDNEEEQKEWEKIFRQAAKELDQKYFPSYRADIQVIRFTRYLNEKLNPHHVLVLYVSGASLIETVFRNTQAQNRAFCSCLGKTSCFFRSLDVFRFYLGYCKGDPHKASPQDIIRKAEQDASALRELTSLENRKIIEEALKKKAENKAYSGIGTLYSQIENVRALRHNLYDSNTTADCKIFMRSYEMGNINLLEPQTYIPLNLHHYAKTIQSILTSAQDYQAEIIEFIFQLKVFIVNEYYGWLDVSRLYETLGQPGRYFKRDFGNFVMFPFRVRFITEALREKVGELSRIIEDYPDQRENEAQYGARFYGVLNDLAKGCSVASTSDENFWHETISLTDRSEKGMERRLAWLVLLCALGYARQVEDDARRILSITDVPLKAEFRISLLQAGVLQLLRMKKDSEECHVKVNDIIGNSLKWFKDAQDPRFLHLAVFAAGTMARHGWLEKYDRNWVVDRSHQVLSLLREAEKVSELPLLELHLKQTLLANLAYYLAVDGDEKDVAEALEIHEGSDLKEVVFTGLCMHNKGYVYLRRMEFSQNKKQIQANYEIAMNCFEEAKKRLFGQRRGNRNELDMKTARQKRKQLLRESQE